MGKELREEDPARSIHGHAYPGQIETALLNGPSVRSALQPAGDGPPRRQCRGWLLRIQVLSEIQDGHAPANLAHPLLETVMAEGLLAGGHGLAVQAGDGGEVRMILQWAQTVMYPMHVDQLVDLPLQCTETLLGGRQPRRRRLRAGTAEEGERQEKQEEERAHESRYGRGREDSPLYAGAFETPCICAGGRMRASGGTAGSLTGRRLTTPSSGACGQTAPSGRDDWRFSHQA